jgi:hypothetical protein
MDEDQIKKLNEIHVLKNGIKEGLKSAYEMKPSKMGRIYS